MRALRLGLALLVAGAAGVASASAVVPHPSPPEPDPAAVEPNGDPPTLRAATAGSSGDVPWVLRVYQSQDGETCAEPGRLMNGRFGHVGPDGHFDELPLEPSGSCADLTDAPVSIAVNHYPATGEQPERTVIFGVANRSVTSVMLRSADGDDELTLDHGAFLAIRPGPPQADLLLLVRLDDGSTRSIPLARPPG